MKPNKKIIKFLILWIITFVTLLISTSLGNDPIKSVLIWILATGLTLLSLVIVFARIKIIVKESIEEGENISNKTSWADKMDAKVKERESKKL